MDSTSTVVSIDPDSPKHDENIRDVVHPSPVHVFRFFVRRRHEQQTTRDQELSTPNQNLHFPWQVDLVDSQKEGDI